MAKVVAKKTLRPHPDFPSPSISVSSKMSRIGSDVLKIEFVVIGAIAQLKVPERKVPERVDDLWQHTCFEAFIGLNDSPRYVEFNFSPSRDHAVYRFDGYRDGMQPAYDLPAPDIYCDSDGPDRLALDAWIDLRPLSILDSVGIGLSAVIEARDGTKSYWALAHAPGPPDFHRRDCFTTTLAAPRHP